MHSTVLCRFTTFPKLKRYRGTRGEHFHQGVIFGQLCFLSCRRGFARAVRGKGGARAFWSVAGVLKTGIRWASENCKPSLACSVLRLWFCKAVRSLVRRFGQCPGIAHTLAWCECPARPLTPRRPRKIWKISDCIIIHVYTLPPTCVRLTCVQRSFLAGLTRSLMCVREVVENCTSRITTGEKLAS